MFRISIRSLMAHKLRMAMSVFAVVLGTAFVSGALVFGSSLTSILDNAFTGSAVDLQVTPKPAVDAGAFGPASTVTLKDDVIGRLRSVPGVAQAQGTVEQLGVYVLDAKNKIAGGTNGGPGQGLAWLGTGGTSRVSQGAPPSGADDVVVDERTADAADLKVGDQATVLLADGTRQQFRVAGLFVPPGADLGQQTQVVFAPATAQRLLLDPGTWSAAAVTLAGGADPTTVKAAVTKELGSGYTVKTRAEQIKDAKDTAGTFVSVFTYVLLGFAVVALLVGGFLIFNTFSMVVAQRAREMALLRAIGAKRRQVSRALLVEAALVGLVGSVVGLLLGLLVAVGLGKLLGTIGFDLTITPGVPASAVVWCLVLGVGVTLLAAWIPTRRAGRIPPVAALRESVTVREGRGRVRFVVGVVLLALAGVLFALALRADGGGTKAILAAGTSALLVVAAVVLAPAAAILLVRILPATGGAPGKLARANTVRNPRRTAATAAAITVGVALVTGVTVFASSLNASVGKAVDEGNFRGEYAISGQFQRVSPELLAKIGSVPGVGSTASQDQYPVLVGTKAQTLGGLGGAFADVYPLKRVAGTVTTIAPGTLMVDKDTASSNGWKVGSVLDTTFADGAKKAFTVAGLYEKTAFVSGLQANLDEAAKLAGVKGVSTAFVTKAPGADTKTLRSGLEAVTADNPLLVVQNTDDLKAQIGGFVNQLLLVVYGLLILSIVIAVLGVVNTMAMAVLERTREIGLLRAIGLSRRQSRRMIRRESVIIALLGALLGVAAGLLVGIALQQATKESLGIDKLGIPYGSIVVFFVLAALVGVISALAPARRASRLDVLAAIATE